jgi:hypothetical protein
MIDGFPYSFFFPLVVHALAGLTTAVTGVVAFRVFKGPPRHHRWGEHYLWAYTVVFLTATILSAQRWQADAYLFVLAVLGYSLALGGYSARRFRPRRQRGAGKRMPCRTTEMNPSHPPCGSAPHADLTPCSAPMAPPCTRDARMSHVRMLARHSEP